MIAGKKYVVSELGQALSKAMIVQRIGKGDSDHRHLSTAQLSDERNRGRKTRRKGAIRRLRESRDSGKVH